MKNKDALLLFFVIVALVCGSVLADTIRLKDGRSYDGVIVQEDDETIKIKLDMLRGAGYVTVRREEVRRIIKETPEEREERIEKQMRASGLVKDGDQWVTEEQKTALEAQKKAEQDQKMQRRAKYLQEIEKLKGEQRESRQKEQAFKDGLDRSREESSGVLRDITLKLVFFAVLAIIAFTILKRYFWD